MSIVTEGGRYVAANGFDVVKQAKPEVLGTLEDGVITFPMVTASNGTEYQGILYMGTSGYYGGTNGAFEIYLPSALENDKMKAKAQSRAKAASFAKRLNAYKATDSRNVVLKKAVKNNAKVIKF